MAWGNALWIAVRTEWPALNGSPTRTGHTLTHSPHEVQSAVT